MLNTVQIQRAIDNLNLLIDNAHNSAAWFSLNEDDALTKNWIFKTQTEEEAREPLQTYLQKLINEVSSNEIDPNDRKYANLFITLQYFLHLHPNRILENLELDYRASPYLERKVLRLQRFGHMQAENQLKGQDLPKINYDLRTGLYTSPDDDKAHQHGSEAGRIWASTQWERFKGFFNWLFAKVGIHVFETARYKEHDYLDNDIYAHDKAIKTTVNNRQTASHYWIGHASNLIAIPTHSSPLHVLTDPVEGDMAPLYPRMTEEASLIDGTGEKRLPKIDVVIISHNHIDHVKISTLKSLVKQQPKMMIPKGDLELFKGLGFTDIVELEWWEQAVIIDHNHNELLRVTAVPTRHWSGRAIHDFHRSAFNGYVLQSNNMDGDIYFAGDTALMKDENSQPIFDKFNITTSIQPGGPDERREDLESTHQSSADGILMHFKILATKYKKLKDQREDLNLNDFLEAIKTIKTIYNHTATFKLGNLRLKDTFFSYQRLVAAFQEDDQWRLDHLPEHELKVYDGILALTDDMVFDGEEALDKKQIVNQILRAVLFPKIGQRLSLDCAEGAEKIQTFQHRYLITNRRALIEYDTLLQDYLFGSLPENFNVKQILLSLVDAYKGPWHAFHTRTYQAIDHFRQALNDCEDNTDLLVVLNDMDKKMETRNQHGHMQSLIHYAKWVIAFSNQHQDETLAEFKGYFACQQIKKMADQEIHHSSWVLGDRAAKQEAFKTLADQLADVPEEIAQYSNVINNWLQAKADDQKTNNTIISEKRGFFAKEVPQSQETVNKITDLVLG